MPGERDAEPEGAGGDQDEAGWDALEVMRARATASRLHRDEAISSLRESMTDDEVRDDFGIDLRQIED